MNKTYIFLMLAVLSYCSCNREKRRSQIPLATTSTESVVKAGPPFQVNIFLENSLSMKGYVNGSTDFKNATYSLMGALSLSDFCKSLNLFFVNSNITEIKRDVQPADLGIVNALNVKTFSAKGTAGTSSDLNAVLASVLKKTDPANMSILISDFIFSPGKKTDAKDYLTRQAIGLQFEIAKKLKTLDLSILVLRATSNFAGEYYTHTDQHQKMNIQRPYYIWFIGTQEQISQVIAADTPDKIQGGYSHKLLFQNIRGARLPKFKIVYNEKVGNFRLKDGAQGPLYDVETSTQPRKRGTFGFMVAADFSGSAYGKTFFTDASNLTVSNDFMARTTALEGIQEGSLQGYSHKINLTTSSPPKPGEIEIVYRVRIPGWVQQVSSNDDRNIFSDKNQQQKTFGLDALMNGIYQGFYPSEDKNKLYQLILTIK